MSGESQRNEKVPHLFGSMLTAMTLADDVGGRFGAGCKGQRCAAVGTGAVGEAMEKTGMKVSRAKTEYMCMKGTPLGSVKMQSDQLP